ncbi:magnesium transporter ApaG [Pokkaliibacter plantistimulans]|uniref:Protein ApaG n=1 Tax=Pokkaliibacter plantistimulans TaxID=1635171 RepID=A0ABX5LTG6_9GAMM|nr:Co2+/Mg2+ efflux protein ApaG [Pokkaliibacter plantistimulans]PXF29947.1 magnesium transporter ApaG [Pokkaliibacter plantistimulans]
MSTEMPPITVDVETQYLSDQSVPEENRFVFSYTITIHNTGLQAAQLLNRHWIITDGNQQIQEVKGKGVVGEQPLIAPGSSYQYSSGCVLATAVGSMRGYYEMKGENGQLFQAPIPAFTLAKPMALH